MLVHHSFLSAEVLCVLHRVIAVKVERNMLPLFALGCVELSADVVLNGTYKLPDRREPAQIAESHPVEGCDEWSGANWAVACIGGDGAMEIRQVEISGNGNRAIPGASDAPVEEVVRQARDELRQLIQQRAEIMKRIGTVKQTIIGLANLFGDGILSAELVELVDRKTSERQPGFTRACRMVLMKAKRPMSTREVCEEIQQRIPLLVSRHKDPIASVTTVLNRLAEYGEARSMLREDGRRAWEWIADTSASAAEERG